MASLATVYRVIDDTGVSAGPAGGLTGGASGNPLGPDFTAPTLAAAAQVAYLLSSVYQRPVRLQPVGSSPPWTLIVGIGANNALTVVPSGIGY